jgi:hypothetical protein
MMLRCNILTPGNTVAKSHIGKQGFEVHFFIGVKY